MTGVLTPKDDPEGGYETQKPNIAAVYTTQQDCISEFAMQLQE